MKDLMLAWDGKGDNQSVFTSQNDNIVKRCLSLFRGSGNDK